MSDRYIDFVNSSLGKSLTSSVGLPQPVRLDRYAHGVDFIGGDILVGAAPGGQLAVHAVNTIKQSSGRLIIKNDNNEITESLLANDAIDFDSTSPDKIKAFVYDASGITQSMDLNALYHFFHAAIKKIARCGRVVILGRPPETCEDPKFATAQRALLGFVKSLGKEVGKGATVNLITVAPGSEEAMQSSLRFFLSGRSAYVSAQEVKIDSGINVDLPDSWELPLKDKVALVTGSARGIGAAIAGIFARQGATVIGLDVPQLDESLTKVMSKIGGHALFGDITADNTPQKIIDFLSEKNLSLDILVHNAGITRDKTIAKMREDWWDLTININLAAQEKMNDALISAGAIAKGGRIVCVSSMNGIAGARGQTNYSASKAGVIGMVESMAPMLVEKDITINAVAPGFIETAMTAAMPFGPREAGRRLNSMSQGGLPEDVGETICWLASPASAGITGNTIRVCGQCFLGA